ncbi:AraC family transcriptional regulator [Paenibacillus psychroresistens]|uniref:AraC family transcriptional regulator n=1 Tax=Paenibacillus psychroresistens TaxID=1778678 RepID=A0A6B8RB38_9BACL|nr:AraC family transcriptional regulator [Paenibacillus psychroresistens]QGQ93841.1 AraC family transcriptional regulator [Paenibacillus psychroresistens]
MNTPFHHYYADDSSGYNIDHVKRKGHFSMTVNHFHNHYELYYLCEGERLYFVQDRTYHVKAGNFVLVDRHVLHRTLDTGMPDHERMLINIEQEWIEASYPNHAAMLLKPFGQGIPVLSFPTAQLAHNQRLIDQISSEMLQQEPGYAIRLQHAVIELLISAARWTQTEDHNPAELQSPAHAKITKIIRYLNDHFAEALNLPDLAARFSISPYYLSRTFKSTTGFTYSEYLNLIRLKAAQRLLRETELNITEIALQTGFENFSHFGKSFKKMALVSPRAYRDQQ